MKRVLFVCMGNICRSPLAEAAARVHAARAGIEIELDSAATHGYHVGEGADPRAVAAGGRRGYDLATHRARRIRSEDFVRYDLVLAMDRANLAALRRMAPAGGSAHVALLLEFAAASADSEVPDPYYGGAQAFERALDLIDAGTASLVTQLR